MTKVQLVSMQPQPQMTRDTAWRHDLTAATDGSPDDNSHSCLGQHVTMPAYLMQLLVAPINKSAPDGFNLQSKVKILL